LKIKPGGMDMLALEEMKPARIRIAPPVFAIAVWICYRDGCDVADMETPASLRAPYK
jgi:hypothetical protein